MPEPASRTDGNATFNGAKATSDVVGEVSTLVILGASSSGQVPGAEPGRERLAAPAKQLALEPRVRLIP